MVHTAVQDFFAPTHRSKSIRRSLIVFIVIAALYYFFVSGSSVTQTAIAPEIPVAKVTLQDVPVYMELVGQTYGSNDISIRARVEGTLEEMHFQEGSRVKKGDLLYTIDPRPFDAKVVEAKSALAEAETVLAKAKNDLRRIKPLAEMNAVSQRELDAAIAQEGAAKASVDAAAASLDFSQIQRSYTTISSPIDGVIGISKAKVGDFVGRSPNPVVLNLVSQIDPIHVRVSVTENDYLRFARQHSAEDQKTRNERKEKYPLQLILADGSTHPHTGTMRVVDSRIDPTTGSLTIEAAFPNPDRILRSGQFARLKLVSEVRENAVLVPQRALKELQGTYSVFVLNSDNTVTLKKVDAGPTTEKLQVIESGLNANDTIVVEGIQKLRDGMSIDPILTK